MAISPPLSASSRFQCFFFFFSCSAHTSMQIPRSLRFKKEKCGCKCFSNEGDAKQECNDRQKKQKRGGTVLSCLGRSAKATALSDGGVAYTPRPRQHQKMRAQLRKEKKKAQKRKRSLLPLNPRLRRYSPEKLRFLHLWFEPLLELR